MIQKLADALVLVNAYLFIIGIVISVIVLIIAASYLGKG